MRFTYIYGGTIYISNSTNKNTFEFNNINLITAKRFIKNEGLNNFVIRNSSFMVLILKNFIY